MKHYVYLELRKNRMLFGAFASLFMLSLPFVAGVARWNELPLRQSIDATLLFWLMLGIPGAAAALAAVAGSGLSNEPEASAEAPLPISPARRSAAAGLGVGLHVLLLAGLIVAMTIVISPLGGLILQPLLGEWERAWRPNSAMGNFIEAAWLLSALTCVYAALLALAWSRWLKNGAMGWLLALLLGGATAAAWTVGLVLEGIYESRAPFQLPLYVSAAAALGAALWVTGDVSAGVDRRPRRGLGRWGLAAGALCLGAAAAAAALGLSFARLTRAQQIISSRDPYGGLNMTLFKGMRIDAPARRHIMLESITGGLSAVDEAGRRRELIPGDAMTPKNLLFHGFWHRIKDVLWEDDGDIWLVKDVSGYGARGYEIWRGNPERAMSLVARTPRYPRQLARFGDDVVLLTRVAAGGQSHYEYAALPPVGPALAWRRADKGFRALVDGAYRAGRVARLVAGGRRVERSRGKGALSWALPAGSRAAAPADAVFPVLGRGGDESVLVPLAGKSPGLAELRADGTVRRLWPGEFLEPPYLYAAPTRGQFAVDRGRLFMRLADGRTLPPTDMRRLENEIRASDGVHGRRYRVLHFDERSVYVLKQRRELVEIAVGGGAARRRTRLPEIVGAIEVTPEGFFHIGERRLRFVGWDGARKTLGPA